MKHVVFICTGNIFRSMTAEYILKDILTKHNDLSIVVSSAGIKALSQRIAKPVLGQLQQYGIDPSNHLQRIITKDIILSADLLIGMTREHKEFIETQFNVPCILFNELAKGDTTDIFDEFEAKEQGLLQISEDEYFKSIVEYIYTMMPNVYANLQQRLS